MSLRGAVIATLRSRRFWLWQIAGVIIYALPAAYRFATKSVAIPILNFPGFWIGYYIPGNFLEKLLVNSFFPGGAGGVAGEVFFGEYSGAPATRRGKYTRRLAGAFLETGAWSAFQFIGYSLVITGPYGSNLFEYAGVFPINFTLAALSVFTPDLVGFIKAKLTKPKKLQS
jgi:hypothetical protein